MQPSKRTAVLAAAATALALVGCASTVDAPAASAPAPTTAATVAAATPTDDAQTEAERRAEFEAAWEEAADAVRPGPVPELLETTAIPVDEYVARFGASSGALEDAAAVNAEYREAARVFPLALPDGWAFPADCWLVDRRVGEWQQGDGAEQAYLFWQMATATAAFHDYLGDRSAASAHLDALAAGYDSPVRAMSIDDPDLDYLTRVVEPAREGNFDELYSADAHRLLGWPEYAAVAERAGDWDYLGTEGYAYEVP